MKLFQKKQEPDMGENAVAWELRRSARASRVNLAVCLLVIVAFGLYSVLSGQRSLIPLLEEERFSMADLDGEIHSFAYADAEYIELRDDLQSLDWGEKLSGTETRRCASGTYRSAEFGEYQLMVMKKLHKYIVVYLPGEILVLNYESDETTEQLYHSFVEDSGYQPSRGAA